MSGLGVMLGFIEDGYTASGYIEAVENLHPSVSFKFRPTLYEENESMDGAMLRKPAAEYTKIYAAAIATKIVSWDLKDRNGCDAPVTLDWVRKIQPTLFEKIRTIVMGRRASDPAPGATATEDHDFAAQLLAGASKGPAQAALDKQEADAKN